MTPTLTALVILQTIHGGLEPVAALTLLDGPAECAALMDSAYALAEAAYGPDPVAQCIQTGAPAVSPFPRRRP